METATSFACRCNGCRNYPTRPDQIQHKEEIAGKAQGYFFSPDTMKMFSSRIVDFRGVAIERADLLGLVVLVSSRYGYQGASRYYEVVYLCPYGNLIRDGQQFDTLYKARKEYQEADSIYGNSAITCPCHGCALDREGRR